MAGTSYKPPLPREHGAWLGLLAACGVGALQDGAPSWPAALATLSAFALFLAKASVEHLVLGLSPRKALIWLGILVSVAISALLPLAGRLPQGAVALVLAVAALALFAHGRARKAKQHRGLVWETVGFFGTGGAASLVALAEGAALEHALALGALVGTHLAATVPYVRLAVRPGEARPRLVLAAFAGAVAGPLLALGLSAGGFVAPGVAIAFLPALVKVALVAARPGVTVAARTIGFSEAALATVFVALVTALA